jgi:hypothetical protein
MVPVGAGLDTGVLGGYQQRYHYSLVALDIFNLPQGKEVSPEVQLRLCVIKKITEDTSSDLAYHNTISYMCKEIIASEALDR